MHAPTTAASHSHPKINYVLIFSMLVVLTAVTVAIAMHRFESELVNILLALTVATTKASLVAYYFMHLKFEGKLIYAIFVVPLVMSIILVVALIPDLVGATHSMHPFNPPPTAVAAPH